MTFVHSQCDCTSSEVQSVGVSGVSGVSVHSQQEENRKMFRCLQLLIKPLGINDLSEHCVDATADLKHSSELGDCPVVCHPQFCKRRVTRQETGVNLGTETLTMLDGGM
jgi:hypothetical protein